MLGVVRRDILLSPTVAKGYSPGSTYGSVFTHLFESIQVVLDLAAFGTRPIRLP
jgi:hypothetical protein